MQRFANKGQGTVLADAVLLSPPFSVLTYGLPPYLPREAWSAGMRVAAPLGRGSRAAVILALRGEGEGDPPPPGLKNLLWPLERHPLLSPEYLDLVRQLALRQSVPMGRILGTVLPSPLRTGKARIRFLGEGMGKDVAPLAMAGLDDAALASCAGAWMRGDAVCLGAVDDPLENEICSLGQDPPWPVRPRAARQMEVLEYLYSHGAVSRRKLADDLGAQGAAALALLAERGLVCIAAAETPPPAHAALSSEAVSLAVAFDLTAEQDAALEAFRACLERGEAATHLLHGVTGSGKSVVYMALAAACLARGRSVMLLAPEVALAHKLFADAKEHLPDAPVYLYHGYQTAVLRDHTFRSVAARDAACLVVGTRSALFLPVANLGAIVMDEEHDTSFKQDEGLPYQAKEVAWYRAATEKALLVLGSATPDVKTFHAAQEGLFPLHTLPDRVGGGTLPSVRLVSVAKGLGASADGVLAPESVAALAACVERGDQAVILLNRRGYAPLMYCLDCGKVLQCPECSISLTYHKGRERAVCHYCGHSQPYPAPCPSCNGMHFLPMGEGTEKLEESLAPLLKSGTRILRLDRDSTRRPGMVESILNAFARKEAQVLVGTQMLSKGHHFPDVTLVIAADADLGLNLPDYRAAERTFQLLVQASGRSGRGEKAGEVVIQTRDPGHYCWEFVKTGDYAGFYAQEIARREKRKYPPFVRLALLRMSFAKDSPKGELLMQEVAQAVRTKAREAGLTVLGPAPAPIAMLRGMRRFHCLIKAESWGPVRDLYLLAQQKAGRSGTLRLALDLDPVNML
ncbi:Primosomal protein N' [uncultured delta proteobacterium]|uniref:Replication restart protein PriA n=1 Tax=uncultured delta proteobacterium TaxID=34034 RepID=A0A212J6G0_9DELT|nr:Primosomal protein N' [uncultured delta proteobacterium]